MPITDQIVSHTRNHLLRTDNILHVVGVITNPARYQSRLRLFKDWYAKMLSTPNVKVYVVEGAYRDRDFQVTDKNNPQHLQVQLDQEIWLKENLINLGVKRLLPKDWKYMCWSDCDIEFEEKGWALETIHQLQYYHLVQPWSDCVDLGPHGEVFQHFKGFCRQHQARIPKQTHPTQPYQYAHSGFSWACTRYFWENVGGLPEFCIVGSADHHCAFASIGEVRKTIHKGMSENFHKLLHQWEDKAMRITRGEVGYVQGLIKHFHHGPKKRRQYRERWSMFVDNKFDPIKDLMKDSQGVLKLINQPKLEHEIHCYNLSRHEDSIDTN